MAASPGPPFSLVSGPFALKAHKHSKVTYMSALTQVWTVLYASQLKMIFFCFMFEQVKYTSWLVVFFMFIARIFRGSLPIRYGLYQP